MRSVLLNVLLVIFLAEKSLALKCYICDSSINPKCADLSDNSIQPQDCNEVKKDTEQGTMMNLLKILHHSKNKTIEPLICQKATATFENGTVLVARRCNGKIDKPDPCNYTIQNQLKYFRDLRSKDLPFEFDCSICEEDDCNNAHSNHTWKPFISLISLLCVLKMLM